VVDEEEVIWGGKMSTITHLLLLASAAPPLCSPLVVLIASALAAEVEEADLEKRKHDELVHPVFSRAAMEAAPILPRIGRKVMRCKVRSWDGKKTGADAGADGDRIEAGTDSALAAGCAAGE
jgi:hypothetical protein